MSYLRNHLRHFVIPGVHALARADGRVLKESDIKVSDREVRAASICEYPEAGMLYAVCSSILRKSNPTRELALGLCRSIGKPGDAKFVYQLDSSSEKRLQKLSEGYDGVEGADVLHSFVSNSIKSLKRKTHKKSTVIYPGRDVWCWEVLSRKVGLPSVYDSRLSRAVAEHQVACKKVIADWKVGDWKRTVMFDSGYYGTVPRAIGRAANLEDVNVLMLSAVKPEEQVFPSHAKARRKALACEYLAKYHRQGRVRDDAPYQELADLDEFIKAALLTIWLWHHVSPARLPSWKDRPVALPPVNRFAQNQFYVPSTSTAQASVVTQFYVPSTSTAQASVATIPTIPWNSGAWNLSSSSAVTTSSFLQFGSGAQTFIPVSQSTLPFLDPATAALVAHGNGISIGNTSLTAGSPGGPASTPTQTPTTIGGFRIIPIPIVTDGNGKPIC